MTTASSRNAAVHVLPHLRTTTLCGRTGSALSWTRYPLRATCKTCRKAEGLARRPAETQRGDA